MVALFCFNTLTFVLSIKTLRYENNTFNNTIIDSFQLISPSSVH